MAMGKLEEQHSQKFLTESILFYLPNDKVIYCIWFIWLNKVVSLSAWWILRVVLPMVSTGLVSNRHLLGEQKYFLCKGS